MNQMKESDLFISFVNPKLKDSEIENRFKLEMLSKSRKYNKYFNTISIIVLITSIVVSVIFARNSNNPKKIFRISLWSSVVLLVILLISIFLSCFKKKSDFIQWLCTFINYSVFCLIFFLLRYTIYYSPVTNDLVHAVFYIGFLCKFIWIELALIDFWENFIINFFIIVFSKFVQTFYFRWDKIIWIYVLVGDVIRLSSIILAYYILRKNRVIKYYYEKTNDLNIWYRDVLDNISSGFIKITNNKINFINKFSFDTCVQNEFIKPEEGRNLKYEDLTTGIEKYSEPVINKIIETTKFVDIDKKIINLYNNMDKKNINKVQCPQSNYDNQSKTVMKNDAIILNEINNEEMNQISTNSPYVPTNHEFLTQKAKDKSSKNTQEINTNITVNMNSQKNTSIPQINEVSKENSSEELNGIFSQIKAILKYKKSTMTNNKFFFLGTSIINENQNYVSRNKSTHFELYGRYYKTETNEIVELIFNDVTRTKIEEEKNAEIRYKSTLLSKMAHEFKSPIICLTEMITEELHNNLKIPENRYNMIKAVSNYLLILTKDIDSFSKLQIENDKSSSGNMQRNNSQINCNNASINVSTYSKIKVNELLSFIESIARYLISKKSFGNQIMFKIITYKGIPEEIFTDEIKLKQILINLLSNSIKFTNDGHIFLILELDKNEKGYLKFSVEDTGIGITEEKKKKLFHCFESKNENTNINKYGAGLGLTITNEMTRQIGKQLQFKSKEGKGSTFWFYVKMNYRKINSDISWEKINNALLCSKNLDLNNLDECNLNVDGNAPGKNDCGINRSNSLYYCKNNTNGEYCDNNINNNNLKGNNCPNNSFSGNSEIINMKNYETIYDNLSNINLESNNNLPNVNKINVNSKNKNGAKNNIIQKSINNIINININNEIKNNEISNELNTSLESCKTDKLSELDLNAFPLISNNNNNSNINTHSNYSNSNSNSNENELISSDKEDPVIKTKKNMKSSKQIKIINKQNHFNILNILIADDVELERKAKIRKLKEYIKKKNMDITLNFIEASDGIEILWNIFQIKKDKNNLSYLNPNCNFININNISKIDLIISDENMFYYSGLKTAKKLCKLEKKLGFKHIPFYLSSGTYSLEILNNNKDIIDNILHKPLENYELNEIFKNYIK